MTETPSFIIHCNKSKTPHYDLIIEKEGVKRSWILPLGIPENVSDRKIAIEKTSLAEASDEANINDLYGQGEISEWDRGDFIIGAENKIKYIFSSNGAKLKGKFLLHNPGWGSWTKKKLWVLEKVAS